MMEKLQAEVLKITHMAASEMKEGKDIYRLLKCFKAWIFYDTPRSIRAELAEHKMIDVALEYVHDDYLTEWAVEVIVEVIHICKNPENYQPLYRLLLERLSAGLLK
jgi:hypothetical protein